MNLDNWKNDKTNNLFEAILSLKNIKECESFFRDLLTIPEIEEFSNRWEVVHLLEEGVSYREISKQTGVSTATITRINQWLNTGMGGYKLIYDRMNKSNKSKKEKRNYKPRSVGLH